jgi:hypothetical protein
VEESRPVDAEHHRVITLAVLREGLRDEDAGVVDERVDTLRRLGQEATMAAPRTAWPMWRFSTGNWRKGAEAGYHDPE